MAIQRCVCSNISRVYGSNTIRSPGPEAARVGDFGQVLGHLAPPVVLVLLGFEVDVRLGAPQRGEVLLDIAHVRVFGDEKAHHEGGVDDLAKAFLLQQVVLGAEHVGRRHPALEHQAHPIVGRADELQRDLIAVQERLESLDGRVVAAGVVAHANVDARQIVRPADARLGRHHDARDAHRVRVPPHPTAVGRRGGVHRPVAGGADFARAARLHVLEGAAAMLDRRLVGAADCRWRQPGGREHGDELVVEPSLTEVVLLFSHPLLEAAVGLDSKRWHIYECTLAEACWPPLRWPS